MIASSRIRSLFDDLETEYTRRIVGARQPDQHSFVLWKQYIDRITDAEKLVVEKSYTFASSLDYSHGTIPSNVYFSHPLRVGAMSGLLVESSVVEAATLGLLHNIFELTSPDENYLEFLIGKEQIRRLKTLTVDRKNQWDNSYKKAYYDNICRSGELTSLVKVLDKLDNVFLIHTNPDEEVRRKYMNEIYNYVIPLAETVSHDISVFLKEVVEFSNYKMRVSG